ncbi:efflux RND transporter periplasmic adaptor subunit [Lichenihabitans sp. PAMC28606]|uniref:efflux RND transporter periplasmic adaptor subunit n=1 Tax=Lichenihabitans sp. PAMC28606 TaxID=2880932 RepID=UPI001D0A65CB|nr:efflux RND transporter periplasmic adaptor subunit [Lichenihabitans sp. PAMC28606]UDL93399.1 efflux RND transporter periplasmic adaptor subunit [Lichenihabitans sp. PAMC28606]
MATGVCLMLAQPGRAAEAARVDLVRVKATTVTASSVQSDISLSGEIAARVQSDISFRLTGKIIERLVEVGQHVGPEDVLARLDPTEQKADVDNAQAGLASAEALLQQAQSTFARQQTLLGNGYATRASFDQAKETLQTTQSQVEAARAALSTALEQLSYTDLRPGVAGVIVSRNAETGQVAQAGQTVFSVAQDGPRDAVFNVYEALLTKPFESKVVDIELQSDPSVTATAHVREISPLVDAATSTIKIKVGLDTTPPKMTLGAAVIGRGRWDRKNEVSVPWSALFEWQSKPAVWVVGDGDVVSLKTVSVDRYGAGIVVLSGGLDSGTRVVTAGLQLLRPGQKVDVATGDTP